MNGLRGLVAIGRLARQPVYPILVMAAIVIGLFTDFGSPWSALWRPMVVAVVCTAFVQIALTALLRGKHIAALLTLLVGLAVVTRELAIGTLVGLDVLLLIALLRRRRRRDEGARLFPMGALAPVANLTAGLLLSIVGATAIYADPFGATPLPARGPATVDAPDIYIVLLDGHPRLDTLRSQFGVDTSNFEAALADRRLELAEYSHSNYNVTFLTLASMFNGAQISDLAADVPPSAALRTLSHLINSGRRVDVFREAGYEIVSIPSAFASAALQRADRYLDTGHLTEFEFSLLRTGFLRNVLPGLQRTWQMDDHRSAVKGVFSNLHRVAREPSSHPRLVFAHVLSPHAPVAFAADGSAVDGPECLPADCNMWAILGTGDSLLERQQQVDQVAFVDSQALAVVDVIESHARRPPVIVLFSDHGLRSSSDDGESLRNLLAWKAPGHPGLFPDHATPVNLLTRLANAYLDAGLPLASEESFRVDLTRGEETDLFSFDLIETGP